ncbi:MAG: CapA family protein [Elusimicrobia bacterium]|nr:CapA family protein [Elusimicrobiota bacterium]
MNAVLVATAVATVVVTGDIRLDGPVARIRAAEGPSAPIALVRGSLEGEFLLGNLEEPLTARGTAVEKKFTFRAPPSSAKILKACGFTGVGVANNHVMDFGPDGLADTLAALDKAGVKHLGAGRDALAARRPLFFEANGLKVGLLAFTSTFPDEAWAGKDRPGVAYSDLAHLTDWVRAAKAECDALVVSFHGGTELAAEPNGVQRAVARAAAQGGADAFIGHHPHVVQAAELIANTVVVHSIGNFLFESPTPGTEKSLIARIRLSKAGAAVELVPIDTDGGRPKPATASQRAEILAALDLYGALKEHPDRVSLAPVQ